MATHSDEHKWASPYKTWVCHVFLFQGRLISKSKENRKNFLTTYGYQYRETANLSFE